MEAITRALTRSEIAEYLREPLERPGIVGRADLVEALTDKDAPQEMIDLVTRRIPEGTRLAGVRDLWVHLSDVLSIEKDRDPRPRPAADR
ncbi:MAG: hypothetical protein R6W48_13010 [Gaiellaceae bacterium]